MTKKAIGRIIPVIILLVAFNVFTFTIPVLRTKGFWIAYAFGTFAILYQLYVISVACSKKNAKGVFYGFPVERLGFYYLLIQMAASVTQITMARTTAGRVAILVDGLIFAFPVIGFITTVTVRDEISRQEKKQKKAG